MGEDKWKFTIDKLVPAEEIINNIEEHHYIDAYLGYEDDFQIDSILYYLKDYKQLQNNWNELKKGLEEDLKEVYRDAGYRHNIVRELLDEMQELEGNNE